MPKTANSLMIKAMAVALSSPGVAFRSPALSSSSGLSAATRVLFPNQSASPFLLSLPTHRASRSVLVFGRGKNRKGFVSSSSSSPKKNKKVRNGTTHTHSLVSREKVRT